MVHSPVHVVELERKGANGRAGCGTPQQNGPFREPLNEPSGKVGRGGFFAFGGGDFFFNLGDHGGDHDIGMMHGDAFGELEVGGAQRRAERHAGEVDGHEFGQFARHAGDFDVSGGVRDDGLVHLDGGAFFFAREVQRNAHRDLFVFSDALEVDVQNLRLVRVHLEGAENDEFFLAVEFHRQDRGVELFLAQRVEDGIVFELDGRGGQSLSARRRRRLAPVPCAVRVVAMIFMGMFPVVCRQSRPIAGGS